MNDKTSLTIKDFLRSSYLKNKLKVDMKNGYENINSQDLSKLYLIFINANNKKYTLNQLIDFDKTFHQELVVCHFSNIQDFWIEPKKVNLYNYDINKLFYWITLAFGKYVSL